MTNKNYIVPSIKLIKENEGPSSKFWITNDFIHTSQRILYCANQLVFAILQLVFSLNSAILFFFLEERKSINNNSNLWKHHPGSLHNGFIQNNGSLPIIHYTVIFEIINKIS